MTETFQRVLKLEGGCNLRDLGGYRTIDGRVVKPGQLYRSGVMAYFTDNDKRALAELGVRVICDLRRAEERSDEPTQWPDAAVKIVECDSSPEQEGRGELSWRDIASAEDAQQVMMDLYRNMPAWLEHRLRGVFDHLASGHVPLLFHCSAGKDRTGLTAALVLHCLGVERETILADYALTNEAVDLLQFVLKHNKFGAGLATHDHPAMQMPADVRQALMRAETAYLEAALAQIESDYLSIDNFLRERFGITAELQDYMRSTMLTE